MPSRENVLLFYCADGRCRKPKAVRGKVNNAVRLAGGLLFPDLCASSLVKIGGEQTFEMSAPINREIKKRIDRLMLAITPETGFAISELIILLAAEAMVKIKNPTRIILMYHTHCGAANVLGLCDTKVRDIYLRWQEVFECCFPTIPVEVKIDMHCESGENHFGHEEVCIAA